MAGEVDDIVQNIVLTGNSDVAEAFNKIQEAGTRAFEAIEKSMEHIGTFKGLETLFAGAAASVAIIGVGLFAFTKEVAESVSSLSDLADQLGTTTENMSGLKAAFAAGGVGAGEMEASFRHLGIVTQQTWTEIKQQSREAASQMVNDAISVQQAQIKLQQAADDVAHTQRDQALQQRANANSVAEARQRLDELNAQAFKNAGIDTSALEHQNAIQREILESKQAQLALDNAKKKAADDAANADNEARLKQLAQLKAEQDLKDIQRKQDDDRKNNIDNVINAVKRLVDGDKNALNSINPSVENLRKGIVGAAGESEKALGNLKGDISDISAPGPGALKVLDTLSEAMGNLTDSTQKTALANAFFGRSVSQSLINVISSKEKLEEFKKRIDELGLGINALDKEVSDKFRESLFGLQNDISLVSAKLATAFGPGFKSILDALDQALISNRQNITQFAIDLSAKAVPVIESFIRVLSGAPDAAKDQWLLDYTDKAKQLASALGTVISAIAGLVQTVVSIAGSAAEAINAVLGTNVNAFDLIFGALVLRATIAFAAVKREAIIAAAETQAAAAAAAKGAAAAAAQSAGAMAGATAAANTSLIAILANQFILVAAIYAGAKAWDAFWDAVGGEGKSSQWDAMFDGAIKKLHAIHEFMTGDFKKGWDDFWAADAEQKKKFEEMDSVDAQIAANKKKRIEDLKKQNDEANKQEIDEKKKTNDEIWKSERDTADKQIAEAKRKSAGTHDAAEQQKRDLEDQRKLAEGTGNNVAQGSTIQGDPNNFKFTNVADDLKKLNEALDKTGVFKTDSFKVERAPTTPEEARARLGGSTIPGLNTGPNAATAKQEAVDTVSEGVAKGIEKTQPQDQKNQGGFNGLRSGEGPTSIPTGLDAGLAQFPSPPEQVPLSRELRDVTDANQPLNNLGDTIRKLLDSIPITDKTKPIPPVQDLSTEPSKVEDAVSKGVADGFKDLPLPQQEGLSRDLNPFGQPGDLTNPPTTGLSDFLSNLFNSLRTQPTQPAPEAQGLTQTAGEAGSPDNTPVPQPEQASAFQQFLIETTSILNQIAEKINGPTNNQLTGPADNVGIRGEAEQAGQEIQVAGTELSTSVEGVATQFDGVATGITDGGGKVADALSSAASQIASAAASAANNSNSNNAPPPVDDSSMSVSAAGGGHIWGPGSETSDSIPAWLSRNEFVQPAHAVRHYGVQFMEDLRHLRFPKFNMGGLVGLLSPQLPRYAGGGMVRGAMSSPSHLGTVDLRTDHGPVRVMAGPSAINQLQRAAATKRMTSTTKRRPEFVG